jgi:dienelactone hydrolase
MTRLAAFVVSLLLPAAAGLAQPAMQTQSRAPLAITDETVGTFHIRQVGSIVLPEGKPPFPAVIVMHGCNGVSESMTVWGRRLASWGYAALIVDSFGPRGVQNVCGHGLDFPGRERARDAFTAADYLRTRPDIDHDHIGLIGFSHGGSTVLAAATEKLVGENGGKPFLAVVSYYPYCPKLQLHFVSDLQILVGDADDWTPAKRCEDLVAKYGEASAHRPTLKVYPGVFHAFDGDRPERVYFGHHLAYDAKAATDSFAVSKAFLDSHLRPGPKQ